MVATVVACGGEEQLESTQPAISVVVTDAPLPATNPPATDTPAAAELPAPVIVLGSDETAPTPIVVEEDSAEVTPTPIPGLIGPDFPENVNPFNRRNRLRSGRSPASPTGSQGVQLSASCAPQSGLSNADIVFEHYAEGGATRFTAIFYSKDAEPIGSIRSGRLIDLEIPKMYDAAFAYSGASGPVRLKVSR